MIKIFKIIEKIVWTLVAIVVIMIFALIAISVVNNAENIWDGETDIPCMKMVKEHGGHSIAVYSNNNKKTTAKQLIRDNRVNFICQADYSQGKEMHMIVKRILDKIKADYEFQRLLDLHQKKAAK